MKREISFTTDSDVFRFYCATERSIYMTFKSKLDAEKNAKIENYALEFAEDLELELIESARKGFSAFSIDFEGREDTHILKNELFLDSLKQLLDGCEVKIKTTEYTNLLFKNKYYKDRLVFSW